MTCIGSYRPPWLCALTLRKRGIDMYLQKSHIGIFRYQQGLRRCTMPGTVRWLLRCLLVMLLCYLFMVQSTPLFARSAAQAQDPPLVTQEIRYHMARSGEVSLVWGVNDNWAVVPEETRPAGTVVKDALMYTPMDCKGDTFVVKVQVPAGATIEYVFLITKTRSGIKVWDANGDSKHYHTVAVQGGVAEVQAPPSVEYQVAANDLDVELPWRCVGLVLVAAVCVVFGAITVQRHIATGESLNHLLIHIQTLIREKRVLFIMVFIAVLYLVAINTALYLWGDDAHYIIVGKSIATGQGFRDIHYPGNPPFTFPIPMFPLLLAPIIYFFDYNLLPMKIFVAVIGVGVVYLVYRYFKNVLDDTQAILLMLFVGVSPQIVSFSHQVMAEVPYLFLFLSSLLYIKKYGSEKEWFTRTGFTSALVVAATCLTKSIGVSVALACIPYLLWDSSSNKLQGLKKACFLILVFTTVWMLFNYSILSDNPYTDYFLRASRSNTAPVGFKELMAKVSANLNVNLRIVPETILYLTLRHPSKIFTVFSWLAVGYGFLYCLFKKRTMLEYYIFFYSSILLFFETTDRGNMRRYLVPIIPLVLYYFMQGLRQIGLRISDFLDSKLDYSVIRNPQPAMESAFRWSASIAFMAVISMLILLNLSSTVQASVLKNEWGGMFDYHNYNWEEYKNMALWAKEHIPPESIVMTRMIYFFHFWSHRKVVWYPWYPYPDLQEDKEQVLRSIYETNADYIVIDSMKIWSLSSSLQQTVVAVIQENPAEFQLVCQDDDNKIYHILSRARSAP